MFCSCNVWVAWAHLRLANFELVVHVGIKSVVSRSQPERNSLLWHVQFVEAVWPVLVWVLLLPFFSWNTFMWVTTQFSEWSSFTLSFAVCPCRWCAVLSCEPQCCRWRRRCTRPTQVFPKMLHTYHHRVILWSHQLPRKPGLLEHSHAR